MSHAEPIAENAHGYARRKARYGHRPWIVWTDKNGEERAEIATAETVKAAMLAHGSQKPFFGYWSDGSGIRMTWRLACLWLRNMKAGCFYHSGN